MEKKKNKTFHIIKTLNKTYIILLQDKLVMRYLILKTLVVY